MVSDASPPPPSKDFAGRRWLKLIGLALLAALGLMAWFVVPAWISVGWGLIPYSTRRDFTVSLLWSLLAVYVAVFLAVLLVSFVVAMTLIRSRSIRGRGAWLPRTILLGVSLLFSLGCLEFGSALRLGWLHRDPTPATVVVEPPREKTPDSSAKTPDSSRLQGDRSSGAEGATEANRPYRIVAIGESSGRGEPYHPWLSVAQIVAWQLERIIPDRKFQTQVLADGGATLERAYQQLADLTERPDAIILFSGHNEFQGRWSWFRTPPYYVDEQPPPTPQRSAVALFLRNSPFCRLVIETIERSQIDTKPPKEVTRQLVDRPLYTREERAKALADFRRRLESLNQYCKDLDALPIYLVPGSNDGGYEPSRSALPPSTTPEDRQAFTLEFLEARSLEKTTPESAIAAYRALLARYPEFAETHFRLARLLELAGNYGDARKHYILAREYDVMPMRCPEEFREAYRETKARHPKILLVDSTRVLEPLSPRGFLDDYLYHDGQHPNLLGYIALAQETLRQLQERRAFGWPESVPVPVIDPDECARHFGIDQERWQTVCSRSAAFHENTAYIRYNPAERLRVEQAYRQAAAQIKEGRSPEETGVTGLGTHPAMDTMPLPLPVPGSSPE